VTVFVVDSGIRSSHSEFGGASSGRVTCGFSAFRGVSCEDAAGHGTHVAGIVGGATYGVAKNVNLVTVRVLDENRMGSTAGVVAAVDYIRKQKQADPTKPMVANMSLGSLYSRAINQAVENAAAAGVVFVVAAGNGNKDACLDSPGSSSTVITVAAINDRDRRASYSNYGPCVSIYAPGTDIQSAWASGDRDYYVMSGTSMASPHVAGVAALYLETSPWWTPEQVWDAMLNDAVRGVVIRPGSQTTDILVNTGNLKVNRKIRGRSSVLGKAVEEAPTDSGNGGDMMGENACHGLLYHCSGNEQCCSGSCTFGICLW